MEAERIELQRVSDIIEMAKRAPEFDEFCNSFDTWGVQSWLGPDEKALHFGIGAFNRIGAEMIEIGTLEGASALFAMAGLRLRGSGTLNSIDPHLGAPPFLGSAPWQFTMEKFRTNVERAGLSAFVRSIVCDSQVASTIWPAIPIDSILIDGDHSYEGCLRDVENWAVKLKPGGFLLIDDADDPVLTELLTLVENLKQIKGLAYERLVEGIGVFRRTNLPAFDLLEEFKTLKGPSTRRPWNLAFVQSLRPDL